MKESVSNGKPITPMLFPYDPEQFWQYLRQIIREEINQVEKQRPELPANDTHNLASKPLYKISDVCVLFHVTKPTIYEWIRQGKLKPIKIQSRVFFRCQDIQQLLEPEPEINSTNY